MPSNHFKINDFSNHRIRIWNKARLIHFTICSVSQWFRLPRNFHFKNIFPFYLIPCSIWRNPKSVKYRQWCVYVVPSTRHLSKYSPTFLKWIKLNGKQCISKLIIKLSQQWTWTWFRNSVLEFQSRVCM